MDEHEPAVGAEFSFARSLPLTRDAIEFAVDAHGGRRRGSDRAPFVLHPLEVAAMLASGGASDALVAAGVLHDVVEHEGTELGGIEARFGRRVGALVAALTEDPAIEPLPARKAALRAQVVAAGADAGLIFAADQLARVRELRVAGTRPDGAADDHDDRADKLERYRASLATLEQLVPGHALVDQLRFELEALVALPPGAAPQPPRQPAPEPALHA